MTDIERAEEFANNGYALGCTKSPFEVAKESFLAGLKAGRPQWHDLRKHLKDLPEENKELDIVITFFDENYRDDICSVEPIATIRLHNGEITPIKTRTWKEVKYLEKVNYFKGSKNYHTKLYYKVRNFGFKLWKNFGKFVEKVFHNSSIYNAWVNEHNYRIMKNPNEQYFTEKEIYNMIDNWLYWCKQNN